MAGKMSKTVYKVDINIVFITAIKYTALSIGSLLLDGKAKAMSCENINCPY